MEVGMRSIRLPDELDHALESAAPGYLKGNRKTEARVAWGIEKLMELLGAPKPTPADKTETAVSSAA